MLPSRLILAECIQAHAEQVTQESDLSVWLQRAVNLTLCNINRGRSKPVKLSI